MRWVEALRRGIEVLAVDLEPVESPFTERLARKGGGILANALDGGAEVLRVPPGDLAGRAVGVAQQPVRVLALRARSGIRAHRRPPQLRLEPGCVDAVDQRFHVGIAG